MVTHWPMVPLMTFESGGSVCLAPASSLMVEDESTVCLSPVVIMLVLVLCVDESNLV